MPANAARGREHLYMAIVKTALEESPRDPSLFARYPLSTGIAVGVATLVPHAFLTPDFSETDFTEDLKKFDVPTLIIHGDDDQIVPIGASAMLSSKLVKNATLKIYPGGSHSLADTSKDQLNKDLLAFIKGEKTATA